MFIIVYTNEIFYDSTRVRTRNISFRLFNFYLSVYTSFLHKIYIKVLIPLTQSECIIIVW